MVGVIDVVTCPVKEWVVKPITKIAIHRVPNRPRKQQRPTDELRVAASPIEDPTLFWLLARMSCNPRYPGRSSQPRRTESERSAALQTLKKHWMEIAGTDLAAITIPLAIAGRKGMRLIVAADLSAVPPWGTWTALSPDKAARSTFTNLRSAVNAALEPYVVDHIEFVAKE